MAADHGAKPRRKTTYLFFGYVYCGVCGGTQKLYPQTNWDKYRCVKCANEIPMDDLEELFSQNLADFLVSDVCLDKLVSKSSERIADLERLIDLGRKELEEIQSKSNSCIELFHGGARSAAEFKEQIEPRAQRKVQLRENIPEMEAEIRSLKRHKGSRNELVSEGKTLAQRWPTLDKERKRAIVEDVLERVTINPDGIEFEFNYGPGTLLPT